MILKPVYVKQNKIKTTNKNCFIEQSNQTEHNW